MRRDHIFKFRLTDIERNELRQLAASAGVSRADYARLAVFGADHMRKLPNAAELVEIRRQISGIARNVNQHQKVLNTAAAENSLDDEVLERHLRLVTYMYQEFKKPADDITNLLKAALAD